MAGRRNAPAGSPKPRTVHLADDVWERLLQMGFNRQPRTTASQIARDLIADGLARLDRKQETRDDRPS